MGMAVTITVLYVIAIWLVFFKFKWLKFNIVWGVVSFWIGFHMLLIFMIGLRFNAPYTIDAHLVRNTIQIVPRLEGPTLLKEVLVEANQPVKKGTPLYKFDTAIYEQKVTLAKAQLVAAEQNVKILATDVDAAQDQLTQANAQLNYAKTQLARFTNLSQGGGARQEDVDKWTAQVEADTAQVGAAEAQLKKAELARANGCDHTIDYRKENVAERVREITGGEGVPVVYDGVGRATLEASLDSLRPRGLLVSFGNASGPVDKFDTGLLSAKGSLYLTRPTLMTYVASDEALRENASDLISMVASGKIEIAVNQRYALADVTAAHRDLEARKTTGSTILMP